MGLGLPWKGKPSRAQAESQPASSTQPVAASSTGTVATYTAFCGLWRTDGAFDSTLRIRNQLLVAPLDVTPILYLADGTEYDLPSVHLATGGVAVVNLNQALASAPAAIAPHLLQFGSAELRYQYSSPGHVVASIQMLNISQSLIFVTPFNGVDGTDDGQHTVEGLWWRRDPEVGGYISLANVTGNAIQVAVQAVGSQGTTEAGGTFALGPHATQMLDLDELVGGLPGTENQAGGLRVQYSGAMNAVMVTGGLVNAKEGYSANLPFWFQDLPGQAGASTSRPAAITYASAGIRAGLPDPVTGFPQGTRFNPYFVLRNTTASALAVSPALHWMTAQGAPASANLPVLTLAPFATQPYDLKSAMAKLGLGNFNGTINLSASFTGQAGDLIVATGSVDTTGTYVFEVEPQGIGNADSKQAAYWSVAQGFDTTFSLWNPTAQAQDLTVTFYYGDGSGSYALPVHLGGNASTTVDMTMLIESQQADASGHPFPMTATAGSAIIRNAASGAVKTTAETKLPAPITLVADVGTFNVQTATCSSSCPNCCGFMNFAITPSNFFCPVGASTQCSLQATDCNGVRTSLSASWSSNNTSVMTVNSTGLATGVAPGTCTITAFASPPVAMGVTCPAFCSFGSPSTNTGGQVDSLVFTVASNGVPNDPNGVIAKTPFILKIQAKSPTGVVPDTSFNAQNVSFTLTNMNTTVGEAVSSSTVNFTSGETDPTVTIVQASGTSTTPSSIRQIVVGANATGTVFLPLVYWKVAMDIERWKNCGFTSCPNAGSYFCQTSCNPNGFPTQTEFVAITQSGLCGKGIALQAQLGTGWSALKSTSVQDCGPAAGGGCSNPYWFNGNVPTKGGCLSDLLATNLGVSNGCNGTTPFGSATVLWRFQ